MRIETQKQLIYLASRLYPCDTFEKLSEENIRLLAPEKSFGKVANETYIGDVHLNNAFSAALSQKNARVIFDEIQRRRVPLSPLEIRERIFQAKDFNDLREVLPPELVKEMESSEDSRDMFLDTMDGFYGGEFKFNRPFGFVRFWKACCTDYRLDESIGIDESLHQLSAVLDTGAIEVEEVDPAKFRLMTNANFYEQLCELFDIDGKAKKFMQNFGM